MDPTGATARRFPLVARTRPACTPLDERVADLTDRARAAEAARDLAGAAAVHNLAALLASDAGLPDLARTWCHRQAKAHLRSHPLGAQGARHALEPLVNLARLHIRNGEGEQAYRLVDSLYTAVSARTTAVIDDVEVPARLTRTVEDHKDVRHWLWAVLLATGAKALATAGRWDKARDRLAEHKGIGRRMLDGRQVAVIARLVDRDTATALDLLNDTEPGDPTENAVTACLTLLATGQHPHPEGLLDRYRDLDPTRPGLTVFHTRLALSFIDATGTATDPSARTLATELIARTLTSPDGYAARDLLTHPGCAALLTTRQHDQMKGQVTACGLGSGTLPARLREDLDAALDATEQTIRDLAGTQPTAPQPPAGIEKAEARRKPPDSRPT
ncbi:hypothetical protein [Kitasatospora griseola]|uniref:hypothetical protein n=1 Tax=Kitasatospora griseola TaxID=2064 RepID=UPI0038287E14